MYRNLKEKCRVRMTDDMYSTTLNNFLCNMFQYDERIYRPELFEWILHNVGSCALIKTPTADYTPVFVQFAGGDRYADGVFKTAITFDFIGNEKSFHDWQSNDEILVFFNDYMRSYDGFIEQIPYLLTETDISLTNNIIYSRSKPVPIVSDSAEKSQVEQIMNDTQDGKIKTILQKLSINQMVDGGTGIDVLNITDPSTSNYIENLSHLYDELWSRVFFYMGFGMRDNGKQAQISTDELNRNLAASLLFLETWHNSRRAGFDIAEEKTGMSWKFDYSELAQMRIDYVYATLRGNQEEGEANETEPVDDAGDNENDTKPEPDSE